MASRTVNAAFDTFVDRLTPTKAQREAGASHRSSVKAALESKLTINGYFETGSFSHGTGVRGYSDIDVLVSIAGGKPDSSYTALTWVKDALEARFPRTQVQVRRPAVVVRFAAGYETWEVIPGFSTPKGDKTQMVYDIPGPKSGSGWIDSAPREHLRYVNECNKEPRIGVAKDLARLIKAWKYYRDVPISSFYLEMRCAQYVASLTTYIHVYDVCYLLEKLARNELAAMSDPKKATGLIRACSSDAKREVALSRLNTAAGRARKALDAYRGNRFDQCFDQLNLLFAGKFPARVY